MINNKIFMRPVDGIIELPDHLYAITDESGKMFTSNCGEGERVIFTTDIRKANLYVERDMAEGMIRNGLYEKALRDCGYPLKVVAVAKEFHVI